jgi:FkbM family methyltransferase
VIVEATTADGVTLRVDCPDTLASRWTSEAILQGRTYPDVPFVGEVRTIVDVGANVGAATVYLAHHHPTATVHAVEPADGALAYLRRNVGDLPNVQVHALGLSDADSEGSLFLHPTDLGQSSLVDAGTGGGSQPVAVRAAGPWAAAQGIEAIDVLKVDVEGLEVAVLESLGALVATAKVLYVEYDHRAARRRIEALLAPTHELYLGELFLDQGECTYVRTDLVADAAPAHEHLRAYLARQLSAGGYVPIGAPHLQ